MKADEITYGYHNFGMFLVSIAPGAHETRSADEVDFFEVLVQKNADGVRYYVDLSAEFDWFGHLSRFERPLTADDVAEYNDRLSKLFHKIGMPTWTLARRSIPHLERLCLEATKKAKKGK